MTPRPDTIQSRTHRFVTGCGRLYVTVGTLDDGTVIEVFAHLGKSGGCTACHVNALTKMVSYGLQSGVPIERVIKGLRGERCHRPAGKPGSADEVLSCVDAIGRALETENNRQKEKAK